MKASLDHIADDPPTYLLRLGDDVHSDPRWLDPYAGVAIVQTRENVGVIIGMCVPDHHYEKEAREAIRVRLEEIGVTELRGFRVVRLKKEENVT